MLTTNVGSWGRTGLTEAQRSGVVCVVWRCSCTSVGFQMTTIRRHAARIWHIISLISSSIVILLYYLRYMRWLGGGVF